MEKWLAVRLECERDMWLAKHLEFAREKWMEVRLVLLMGENLEKMKALGMDLLMAESWDTEKEEWSGQRLDFVKET